jgi:putative DNA primase/helicase
MKDAILQHFAGNWRPFYEGYLGELKPAGKEYRVLCPFHDDHNPSLYINPTSGEWFCHACQVGGDAFTLVEKKTGLNFPAVLQEIGAKFSITGNGSKPKSTTQRKLVKRYTYQDATGAPLFYKYRFVPKAFNISRPDGNGGYLSGMGGIAPVLYRLPEVIVAGEVWIVEGEKDADALAELGFVATTNFDGAGKWSESYNEALRGKQVILVPDADDPGRAHMQKVAAALDGVAASVKILELPNPTKKGYDVSDFLAEQTDKDTVAERLSLMAEGAQAYQPTSPEAEKPRFEFIHIADVLADLRPGLR